MIGPIIAVLRGIQEGEAARLVEALAEGGVRTVEFAFERAEVESWRQTARMIAETRQRLDGEVTVGAGTILIEDELTLAAEAGAEFIVSPVVEEAIIRAAKAKGLIAIPGAFTPTEIERAAKAGADYVKVFPAGTLGADYFKAITTPLSHIRLLAFGGITLQNIAAYRAAGCFGVGVSGKLVDLAALARSDFAAITTSARRLVEAWEGQQI